MTCHKFESKNHLLKKKKKSKRFSNFTKVRALFIKSKHTETSKTKQFIYNSTGPTILYMYNFGGLIFQSVGH